MKIQNGSKFIKLGCVLNNKISSNVANMIECAMVYCPYIFLVPYYLSSYRTCSHYFRCSTYQFLILNTYCGEPHNSLLFTKWYKNVVFFLLGDSPASEFYMPTFRNTLSVPSS